MLNWEALAPFLLTCIIIESTPGPNMAFLTIVSATHGRRYGFVTVLGVTTGLLVVGFAAAAGLATIIASSPLLYQSLRYGGVFYLAWLALCEWRDAGRGLKQTDNNPRTLIAFFQHGLIVNVLNPKAGVFYVTILPSFINPEENVLSQALALTFTYVAIATLAHLLIVSLAGFIKPLLNNPTRKRLLHRFFAVLLGLIALWFGLSSQA